MGRVFADGSGDLGSIPGRVIPKTLKTGLDTSLLNTQQYKVCIAGKVGQSRERSSALPYNSLWYVYISIYVCVYVRFYCLHSLFGHWRTWACIREIIFFSVVFISSTRNLRLFLQGYILVPARNKPWLKLCIVSEHSQHFYSLTVVWLETVKLLVAINFYYCWGGFCCFNVTWTFEGYSVP